MIDLLASAIYGAFLLAGVWLTASSASNATNPAGRITCWVMCASFAATLVTAGATRGLLWAL